MSELKGKTQHSEKDCEIVYVEEKAPEPWIQRESFYNKDLPLPEDDEERLSDARHIGSFMVPSPLMRLKTPSSMSSFKSERSEDEGRISPVPSLDRSIKSERGDFDPSLARSASGLSSAGSIPQLYGLFDDSRISVKDDVNLDEDGQVIESSPLVIGNEVLSEATPDVDKYHLISGAAGNVDGKLGLASIMQPEVLANKHAISTDGLASLNNQTQTLDPSKPIHFKSDQQIVDTSTSNVDNKTDVVKEGKADLKSRKGEYQSNLSNSRDNVLENLSMNVGNLVEESMNASAMEACIGSSAMTPLVASGIVAGVLLSELSDRENVPSSSEIKKSESDQRKDFISKEGNLAHESGHAAVEEGKLFSGIENAGVIQRNGQMTDEGIENKGIGYENFDEVNLQAEKSNLRGPMEENAQQGTGYGKLSEEKIQTVDSDVGEYAQQENDVDNGFKGTGNASNNEGQIYSGSSHLDGQMKTYPQEESTKYMNIEVSAPGILPIDTSAMSSKTGEKLSEIKQGQEQEHGIDELPLGDNNGEFSVGAANGLEAETKPNRITHDSSILYNNLASNGYVEPDHSSEGNAQAPRGDINDQNDVQKLLNPSVEIRLEEDYISSINNLNDLREAADMRDNLVDSSEKLSETMLENQDPEANLRLGKETQDESKDSKTNSIFDRVLSNMGLAFAAGAAPSVIGTSAEMMAGSGIAETQSAEILGMNESPVKSEGIRPEYTSEMIGELDKPSVDSYDANLARDSLDDSKRSNLADMSALTRDNSSVQLDMTSSTAIEDNFDSSNIEGNLDQLIGSENANEIHSNQLASTQQGAQNSEDLQSETQSIDAQIYPVGASSSVDKFDTGTLENEIAGQDDTQLMDSARLGSDADKLVIGTKEPSKQSVLHEALQEESEGSQLGATNLGAKVHSLPIRVANDGYDQNASGDENVEHGHMPKTLNENELNSILFAFDSLLNSDSDMKVVAEHLSANGISSNDYAKAWLESLFSGPEFSPALQAKASSIYEEHGPAGLVEIALDLIKLNSDELLALDSRNDILTKLTSDMNPKEASLGELGLRKISPELFSSLQDDFANMLEGNNEFDYDSKLTLLVARCRNAEELLKQLSEIIKEMNNDINELTRENNNKSLRIKTLEDALQKKI